MIDQNFGSSKKFCLFNVDHTKIFFFHKWIHQATGCPKKRKWPYFGIKMEVFGHDQNIGFP